MAGTDDLPGQSYSAATLLGNQEQIMVPSLLQDGARFFVGRFLRRYISTGCLIITEGGSTVFGFEGTSKKCSLKSVLKVHNPGFYWKLMSAADLGFADAYINGDFSFADENGGLLNFFMLLIANENANKAASREDKKRRGWWNPLMITSYIASKVGYFRHVLIMRNSLTQAPKNIADHYDLSNELFALFLDQRMIYSCAIFQNEDEDLETAQLRKISVWIKKAKIGKDHEVLDIGSGWGGFAIEVVKQTGCKYTGITLSLQQLKYAEIRVKQAGLQDHIKFQLCDYRELPKSHKYDRIIACGTLEHIGHEYMGEFFSCCESVLAEDGLLALQFTSIAEEKYDKYRKSRDFIKEYIFPGGCLPSLSRVTSAMAAASRLCVEHVENIGSHYYTTLVHWKRNFMQNKRKIESIGEGLDDKFIRKWEYYFDYCGAGFKSYMLANYQVVLSRPGNIGALGYPYKGFPSAYDTA